MTEQDIKRLEAAFEAAEEAAKEASECRRAALRELREAKVAFAEANPHPWLGKAVKRQVRHGYSGGTKTRRGTVAMFDPSKHRGLRELSAEPGEPIVVTASGQTAWSLNQHKRWSAVKPPETDWELDA